MGVRSPLPSPKQCRRKWGKMEAGADRHTPADWPRTEDLKTPSRTASFLLFPLSPRASFVMHPAHCSSTLPIHTRGTAARGERPGNNKRICASNSFRLVFFCTGGLAGTICFVPRTISEYKVEEEKRGNEKKSPAFSKRTKVCKRCRKRANKRNQLSILRMRISIIRTI